MKYLNLTPTIRIEEVNCGDGRLTPRLVGDADPDIQLALRTAAESVQPTGENIGGLGRIFSRSDLELIRDRAFSILEKMHKEAEDDHTNQ